MPIECLYFTLSTYIIYLSNIDWLVGVGVSVLTVHLLPWKQQNRQVKLTEKNSPRFKNRYLHKLTPVLPKITLPEPRWNLVFPDRLWNLSLRLSSLFGCWLSWIWVDLTDKINEEEKVSHELTWSAKSVWWKEGSYSSGLSRSICRGRQCPYLDCTQWEVWLP